jgi:hypothetical protein
MPARLEHREINEEWMIQVLFPQEHIPRVHVAMGRREHHRKFAVESTRIAGAADELPLMKVSLRHIGIILWARCIAVSRFSHAEMVLVGAWAIMCAS